MTNWTVHIVLCMDGSLFTGIAKDGARRVEEHDAKYPIEGYLMNTEKKQMLRAVFCALR